MGGSWFKHLLLFLLVFLKVGWFGLVAFAYVWIGIGWRWFG